MKVEAMVRDAEARGRILGVRLPLDEDDAEPWTAPPSRRWREPPIAGPLPETLAIVLGNEIYIAKGELPPGLRNRLLRLAAFQNPKFYKAQAMRLPTSRASSAARRTIRGTSACRAGASMSCANCWRTCA